MLHVDTLVAKSQSEPFIKQNCYMYNFYQIYLMFVIILIIISKML